MAREVRQPLFYERLLAPIRSLLDDSAFVLTRRFALEFASFKRSRRAALAPSSFNRLRAHSRLAALEQNFPFVLMMQTATN